jgi:hypothetical protein
VATFGVVIGTLLPTVGSPGAALLGFTIEPRDGSLRIPSGTFRGQPHEQSLLDMD